MAIIDIDALLHEIDPASPCGPNLEYDPEFLKLDLAIIGKPEVQYGNNITPAVAPEWKVVKRLALGLTGRSRDLRLAVPLLRSLLALHGVAGFTEGLSFIERMLEERWDTLHPQLDPDDDMDPMLRINSLAMLADAATVLKELKETSLITLPGLGPLSLRVLEISSGELEPAKGQEKIAVTSLAAALGDLELEHVKAAADALRLAFNSATNIEVILVRHVGSAQALNLGALTKSLKRGRDFLQEHLKIRIGTEPEALEVALEAEAVVEGAEPLRVAAVTVISSDISSPPDVIRMLDKILKYYQQHEPSSPVPLLLARARRLAPMSFLEVLNDLAPDGMTQLLVISGPQDGA